MYRKHSRHAQQRLIRQHVAESDAQAFFNVLTGPELFDEIESLLPPHRERLFPPTETLAMFLAQALSADRSCQKAVNDFAVKRLVGGLSPCSTQTGAYCKARHRLPEAMVRTLTQAAGKAITTCAPAAWRWRGRPVRLVDGTTVTLPDTPANQAAYPQSRTQKSGLGFPLCRVVGLMCLGSGAVLNAAVGCFRGKGGDEQALLRSILDTLARGDVLLGDAYFPTYFLLCALIERGVDGVFEQYGARQRSTDFRRGQRLGQRDHLVSWSKPARKPDWLSQIHYDQAPETLTVRELRVGGKVLVTTLLCPQQTAKAELKGLYRQRWQVELDLRHIKTTMGMATLSCLTPEMALKELWVYLLAYNLIRLLMAQAALLSACLPRELSFKHTVQLWIAWAHYGPGFAAGDPCDGLFVMIAQHAVGQRPGRIEPRALKRRPNPYPLLMKPRDTMREQLKRHGHPKKQKA